jgi:uncharacterized repeat protein (TIGR02543 family)
LLEITSITVSGIVLVNVAYFEPYNVTNNPRPVAVYRDPLMKRIKVSTQSGLLAPGVEGVATFNVTTENILPGTLITLNNLDNAPDVYLETQYTTQSATVLKIYTGTQSRQGVYRFSLGIAGATSNVFTLTIGTAVTYTVSVNNSYAGRSGSGRYSPGQVVTINAGTRPNYVFNGWRSSGDTVLFSNANSSITTFIMPSGSVSISANWTGTGLGPSTLAGASSWAVYGLARGITLGFVPQDMQSKYKQVITRAEFCSIVVTFYESITKQEILGRTTFYDTTDVNVEKAAFIGVVSGTGNNRFNPNGIMTREQVIVMLANLATELGRPFPRGNPTFSDTTSISHWAVVAVGQAQAAGIVSGNGSGKFLPASRFTREQSVVAIMNLYDYMR